MQRVVVVLFAFSAASCLTTVEQRWCDQSRPCTAGFVCTPDFHCVLAPRRDAGLGGGAGGGTGGGVVGGGGGALGGGGGALGGGGGALGGGGGALGGGGGGAMGGGGGAMGGGGGSACDALSCPGGCCAGDRCVPFTFQGQSLCGGGGDLCRRCPMSERCISGACVATPDAGPPDAGPPGAVGSPCTSDGHCGNDGFSFCIPANANGEPTGFVGGYCSRLCDNAPCPTGARCVAADDGAGGEVNICLAGCMTVAQCRMGYFCETGFGPGVCVP
jgi:hypothetical protein